MTVHWEYHGHRVKLIEADGPLSKISDHEGYIEIVNTSDLVLVDNETGDES